MRFNVGYGNHWAVGNEGIICDCGKAREHNGLTDILRLDVGMYQIALVMEV
jgi:hypothetical protein